MDKLQEIARQIVSRDNFLLIGHAIPDGDCIGSMLGLYMGLTQIGKQAKMLLSDPVLPVYNYLFAVEHIKLPHTGLNIPPNIIFLDCSDEERIGEQTLDFLGNRSCTINIDHHRTNNLFGDFNYVDAKAAATAEIVYELLLCMKVEISPQIADALYAGIIMDTGSFLNSNTTSNTMRITANLMEHGADVDQARINLFESKRREEVLILQRALQHLTFSEDGRIAWMKLPYEELKSIGAQELFPEGIINYTRMIKGVEVGMLFRESESGIIKIGFRSKKLIDVCSIAEQFGGGGHRQAAGARQEGSMDEVCARVVQVVKDVIDNCMDS